MILAQSHIPRNLLHLEARRPQQAMLLAMDLLPKALQVPTEVVVSRNGTSASMRLD